MSEPAYITRAQSADPPAHLVRLMSVAAYEAGRPPGSGRPEYDKTSPAWQAAGRREMLAALKAAEAAGYRIIAP